MSSSGMFAKLTSFVIPPDEGEEDAPQEIESQSSSRAAALWARAREVTGLAPAREELVDQVCPGMTFKQRLYAFCICFGISLAISLTSMFSVAQLIAGNPAPFAVKYTLGNILSLLSTGFIIGPKRQVRNMTHPVRAASAFAYVLAMAATLLSAMLFHRALLVLLCILIQFAAMAWYILSYIPFGRRIVSRFANDFI
mmetsp:Transcript_5591/g.17203  ORF Transcript_5591/g.17203 Transcript_5591/m.17203 type:complete len:197 (-) Transcript_5591:127-717(-)